MKPETEIQIAGGVLALYALWGVFISASSLLSGGESIATHGINLVVTLALLAGAVGVLRFQQWGLYATAGGMAAGVILAFTSSFPGGFFSLIFLAIIADLYKSRDHLR